MATDGQELFIVWEEGATYQRPGKVYMATVALYGPLSANVRELASDAGTDGNLEVVWNGSVFVVAYQRYNSRSIVATRTDPDGNPLDPEAVQLTPERSSAFTADANPRLSWNGSEYLLVWQRTWLGSPSSIPEDLVTYAAVSVQRYTENLTIVGAEIPLLDWVHNAFGSPTNIDNYWIDDVSFSGGLWLVVWNGGYGGAAVYARIDASGTRLDRIEGLPIEYRSPFLWTADLLNGPLMSPVDGGWEGVSVGDDYYMHPVSVGHIGLDGVATSFADVPGDPGFIESVVMAPLPMIAYKRGPADPLAYIRVLPPARRRAAGH
jgi:hypothetical protein